MYFYYQNLKKEDIHRKSLIYGRCWWDHGKFLHLSWRIPSGDIRLELELNHYGDTAIAFHVSFLLFSLYISTENTKIYKFLEKYTKRSDMKYTNGRTIGFYVSDWQLHISLWEDPDEHRSSDPKWMSKHIDLKDVLLGKSTHKREVLKTGRVLVDMPEGLYPATYEIERRTWTRPRWHPVVQTSAYFDIPVGIPHEGKGESEWDCGMDATHGIGTPWKQNIYDASKKISLSCLETRVRYGSLSSPEYAKWRKERFESLGIIDEISNLEKWVGVE